MAAINRASAALLSCMYMLLPVLYISTLAGSRIEAAHLDVLHLMHTASPTRRLVHATVTPLTLSCGTASRSPR